MDSKQFRLRQSPDILYQPGYSQVRQETTREIDATKTVPAPDARFRAYAAPLSDGRLVTDYRQACVTRAPPGTQFAVKQWTVHNTDEIIRITRDREAQATGQALGTADVELPPKTIQMCSTDRCTFTQTHQNGGLGLERDDPAPPLFGTFNPSPSWATQAKNTQSIALTTRFEYGRNTATRWARLYQ